MSAAATEPATPRVCVVLVNWNGWADTIECLESLLRSDYPDFQAVVCDNGSTDGSVAKLAAWAEGAAVWPGPAPGELARLSLPPVPKPLRLAIIGAHDGPGAHTRDARVVVIETGANLGFAGGNNAGIRFALAQEGVRFVWLLNNDTVVEPDTLKRLAARMAETPEAGPCGATLRFYHRPHIVQARNGSRFNRWTAQSRLLCAGEPAAAPVDRTAIERATDYVVGASMFLTRRFLETVGPMEERYFLYYEEIDWAVRAGRRFPPVYAPEAAVYHKEGGSIGSSSAKGGRSVLSEFYLARGKWLFTRKFFPWLLPVTGLVTLAQIVRRLLRGQPRLAAAILRACIGAAPPPPARPTSGRYSSAAAKGSAPPLSAHSETAP